MTESAAAFQNRVDEQRSSNRVIYEYDVPESLQSAEVSATIGMVKLTGREEQAATKKAKDSTSLAYDLVKATIFEIDGRRLDRSKFEDEKIWNAMDPQLRNLCMAAYAQLHNPEDDVTENFLKARKEKVG